MTERYYRWLFWTLALVGFFADLGSKYSVFRALYVEGGGVENGRGEHKIIDGLFSFTVYHEPIREVRPDGAFLTRLQTVSGEALPHVNHGALFGAGDSYDRSNNIFALVSIVAAIGIMYWSSRPTMARDRLLCGALGLILAGTLGNLYDRLVFHGVRDFIDVHIVINKNLHQWPIFNVADCCLVCGAGLLLIQAFFSKAPVHEEKPSVASNSNPPSPEAKGA